MGKSEQWVMGQADQRFAWLENDEGKHVACIERVGDGAVATLVEGEFRTTDEQWQAIIDDIARVPELIACLREVAHELPSIAGITARTEQWVREIVRKTTRPVKRKVQLTIEVEVEPDMSGAAYLRTPAWMLAVERVRDTLDCVVVNTKEIS
jgi:hypothetical protein